VVAATDADAKRIAAAAYPRWARAMAFLWERAQQDFVLKDIYPKDFDSLEKIGHGIAGSPETVRNYIDQLQRDTGINYLICQMVFGDISVADAERSLTLFAREVMPAFAR
jgi:alkanesulfonate monooxygenase SsuD/methylene tetrahydromethanopterin reductase-like flavin-dependent oxidoreductase (luciferase family)